MSEEFSVMDLLDALGEIEKEAMAGGTIPAEMQLEVGWGFLLDGTPGHETFWSFDVGSNKEANAESSQKAKEDCLADIAERQLDGKDDRPRKWPNFEYHLVVYKDSVKTDAGEGWQGDRHFIYPYWGGHSEPAVNVRRVVDEVLKPAIQELGITKFPNRFWGELAFRPDPTGRMGTDANDEERVELVAYPAKRYASEAEAEATVVQSDNAPLSDSIKKAVKAAYREALKGGMSSNEAAEYLGSPEEWGYGADAIRSIVE